MDGKTGLCIAWNAVSRSGRCQRPVRAGRRGVRHRPDRRVRRDHGGRHSERAVSRRIHRNQSGCHEHAAASCARRRTRIFASGEHGVYGNYKEEYNKNVDDIGLVDDDDIEYRYEVYPYINAKNVIENK